MICLGRPSKDSTLLWRIVVFSGSTTTFPQNIFGPQNNNITQNIFMSYNITLEYIQVISLQNRTSPILLQLSKCVSPHTGFLPIQTITRTILVILSISGSFSNPSWLSPRTNSCACSSHVARLSWQ